jgi:cytochrome P450
MTEQNVAAGDHPISFADPSIQQCPFHAYETLRDEAPVYRDPLTGNYVLTRYEDIRKAVLNPAQLSNKTGIIMTREGEGAKLSDQMFAERGWPMVDTLVTNDPPTHRLYRSLVDKAFAPSKITAMEGRIAEIADGLIDAFIDKPEIDFLADFAVELPMTVIAEQLGVAASDMDRFKRWSDCGVEGTSPVLTPERELVVAEALIELQNYMAARAEHFLREPDESKLLSRLVHAEIDGRRLDMAELLSIVQQLLVAGNETTTAALAAGMKLMIDDPSLPDRLRREPDRMRTFVEETLRILAPIQALFRRTKCPIAIGGVEIPEGAIVEVRYGSGNLDPRVYERPDEVDLGRTNANTHLTFGSGIHLCIGNQLARGELRVGFSRLIQRLGDFRATRGADSYAYTSVYISYGLTQLWMGFDRR